ncbi:hypothetical protein QBC37DRAFT_7188 [Rhypophila decipiens]|uniref:Uncharacterized protein n=1 Tax=Rhypophila decipiens TaxID=261697 RepID=A0AAN7BEL0_9PEZI|nr:hypothetical protein QBC37DRAFT_7188 [Rhypophila decipiens]
MDSMRQSVDSRRQPEPWVSRFCRITKILSCGCMIATAVLFPLASSYAGGLWFGAVTLAIFIITALVFHSLHIEPFIRFGPYTAPPALLLLLLAVLPAGPSRKDLIPWLPLFIVSCSLGTVAVDKASKHLRLRRGSELMADDFSGVAIDSWSENSFRTVSDRQGRRTPSQSNRLHPLYFGRFGPSSQYSYQARSESDITLGGVIGQPRPSWDAQTQGYFETEATLDPAGHAQSGMTRDMEPEEDSTSETHSDRSDHPLLGDQ